MKALTRQQQRFCEEYLVDSNATRAYMRAGYKASKSSAARCGTRLLNNVQVLAEVGRLKAAQSERTQMKADEVLRLWSIRARGTIEGIVDVKNGRVTVTDFKELTPEQKLTIKSVRETKDGVTVEMHDPGVPLAHLAKHFGLFDKKPAQAENVLLVLNMGRPPDEPEDEEEVPRSSAPRPATRLLFSD